MGEAKALEGEIVRVGRPPKLTPIERVQVYKALEDYIARTPDPTIVGFVAWDPVAINLDVTDDNINDWEEFSRLRKRALKKQEAYLVHGATTNKINPTMAIFRLKQPAHGYKDKFETDLTSGGDKLAPVLVRFITSGAEVGNTDTDGV